MLLLATYTINPVKRENWKIKIKMFIVKGITNSANDVYFVTSLNIACQTNKKTYLPKNLSVK